MKRLGLLIITMMLLLIALPACGAEETPVSDATATSPAAETSPTEAPAAEAPATEAPAAEAPATEAPATGAATSPHAELARAYNGEFKGANVSAFGVWVDEEEANFQAVVDDFTAKTGINVVYEGSKEFETLITVRVDGNNAPDVAMFPQPGLMASFARDNKLVDLATFMNMDALKEDYIQSWLDLGSVDGTLHGVFYRASAKSLVWYPVKAFEAKGYTIPETWEELIALSDQMAADGSSPWCISIEHGGTTGWVATDWLEDVLLRTAGAEVYDQWVNHEIPFDHPDVKAALDLMGEIWMNEEYVYGGTTGILTIPVADTQNPMFEDEPACWMYRQAGWVPAFFPEGKTAGADANFFYLPPIDPAHGKPVLGGGDQFAMFNDRPEVRAFMQYLATADAAKVWVAKGGFISPNQSVALDLYPNEIDRRQAEIIQNATTFRFDASDLMPAEVGTGTFWKGMVDWVGGKDAASVLADIDASWPTN